MQQALLVLEDVFGKNKIDVGIITALRERLAQPEQEPFGYFQYSIHLDAWVQNKEESKGIAFYTAPPQRKPLTDEEIGLLTTEPRFSHIDTPTLAAFARAVIAKATGGKE